MKSKLIKILIHVAIFVSIAFLTQAQVKIGVNPKSIAPTSVLEVEAANGKKVIVDKATGSLHVQNIPVASTTTVSSVVVDNTTGELQIAPPAPPTVKPLTVIKYILNDVSGAKVNQFDTKIPANQYTMAVIGTSFSKRLSGAGPHNVYFEILTPALGEPTWVLKADYASVTTSDGTNGQWTIDVLVINKAVCTTLNNIEFSMNGNIDGAATAKPNGL